VIGISKVQASCDALVFDSQTSEQGGPNVKSYILQLIDAIQQVAPGSFFLA
jgi:hypothetical protein